MHILRKSRLTAFLILNSRKSSRNGVYLARYVTGNSDPGWPNPERKKSTPAKILHRVSQTLTDVPNKVQAKGENLAKASLKKISGSISAFDNLLGISAVRQAQEKVREAEDLFMSFRKFVQEAEKELEIVRTQLNDVRKRLDRVSRDDERYLSLATEEHSILLEEKRLKVALKDWENKERDQFAMLSGIVRESHEKERERVERTKHWSVVGSIVGAAVGIISSSVINYIRLKEVKSSVKGTGEELMARSSEILDLVSSQDSKLAANGNEIKEALEVQREEITNKLIDLRDSIDTYTLSASIGSDAGTVEAGISLKSLTEQLRELVHLQLARQREKIEEGTDKSSIPNVIQNQLNNLKEENRSNFAELFVGLKSLDTKMGLRKDKILLNKESSDKAVQYSDQVTEKYDTNLHQAEYWSKIQIITSIMSITTTLILIANEFIK